MEALNTGLCDRCLGRRRVATHEVIPYVLIVIILYLVPSGLRHLPILLGFLKAPQTSLCGRRQWRRRVTPHEISEGSLVVRILDLVPSGLRHLPVLLGLLDTLQAR